MAGQEKQATFAEILQAVGTLVEEVKVLVTAVDDLRCEVEWQARNQAHVDSFDVPVQPADVLAEPQGSEVDGDRQLRSAADALRELEVSLLSGPRGEWRDDWATDDDVQMPEGRVIPVDLDLWSDILEIRPAHVVGEGCCCEEGIGAPYLIARMGPGPDEYLVRELSENEARRLQQCCLAVAEEERLAAELKRAAFASPTATQRDLF